MSDLRERLQNETKAAMRARDKQRLGVLRLISADIQRLEVDERRTLAEPDLLAVLNRMLKQRRDSLQQYQAAGREDLAAQESYEIDVINEFMPAQLEAAALQALIQAAIAETGASGAKDMGKVMNLLRPQVTGRTDMAALSQAVKAALAD